MRRNTSAISITTHSSSSSSYLSPFPVSSFDPHTDSPTTHFVLTFISKTISMESFFSSLSDHIIHKIFNYLQEDPRHWPRLASVCTRFSSLIRDSCSKNSCFHTVPSDLLSSTAAATTIASLHKLSVCCPGLLHAGILLDDISDFGLHRDLGPDQPLLITPSNDVVSSAASSSSDSHNCFWSLYDDLYHDTIYNPSEGETEEQEPEQAPPLQRNNSSQNDTECGVLSSGCKKRKVSGSWNSHLASGIWNLSREQGSKLLGRLFRDDALYVCDWPGCVHEEEKRKYMVFRGVFRDFKRTRVWRTINDGNRKKVDLGCAFCLCEETWDLHSAFCLRRGFGYHDDGEPVVRAFVCENGHVSGAWTDVPMYT
ncbi:hypothetical protein RIF29_24931 [Crotalaria pallida]|uniref:F-box domain-containing protein n=1 Tax=Crotalaria pallida TaxID=3830 RepID=A0AAN9HYV2_CROPI